MAKEPNKEVPVPSLAEIQRERKRIRRKIYYRQSLRSTVSVLVVVAAVAVVLEVVRPKSPMLTTASRLSRS